MAEATDSDAKEFAELIKKVKHEIHKVIVGQEELVDLTLQCIFCHNHALLMGVPGLAKTLLVETIAKVVGIKSSRIQFTPDLMPSDITGTEIIQEDPDTGRKEFKFIPGPIFSNMLLADEINRTPPKTQAALLEAMQEKQVSVGNQKYKLDLPFFVLATQNPIEQEGTYTLPEAQLDRFMYLIVVDYPEGLDEVEILRRTTTNYRDDPEPVLSAEIILKYQKIVREIIVREDLLDYVVRLVQATRISQDYCSDYAKEWVSWGAGPRACQNLILGAKAHAFFHGRTHATFDDIKAVAIPVLRHRVIVNYAAISEGITSVMVVNHILDEVPGPGDAVLA
ncbi:MAG: MoxR family ATPase [Lentisphaeria bacterium]|nr:MoxR family ATPase [Lentisphaeria bacterium]NQZ68293.1 MoxR family ATPase [Lentisphaeria bacterium]